MNKTTLTEAVAKCKDETRAALQTVYDALNQGQRKKIVKDEGKVLTKDGENFTTCTDVESAEGWYEVDAPEEEVE